MCGINENCPCTNSGCPRHGNCMECVEFHKAKGDKPPLCIRLVKWTDWHC